MVCQTFCEGGIVVVQKLTIFDTVPTIAFGLGDMVELVVNLEKKEVEDYYYLKSHEGRVIKVLPRQPYEVWFTKSNRIGIFRHGELKRRNYG